MAATRNAIDVADAASPRTPNPTQAGGETRLAPHAGEAKRNRRGRREHRPSARTEGDSTDQLRVDRRALTRIMHQGPDPGRDTRASVW